MYHRTIPAGDGDQNIIKAEIQLTDIADALQGDWLMLAQQLGISDEQIYRIQTEYTYVCEQALVMLHLWMQQNADGATGELMGLGCALLREWLWLLREIIFIETRQSALSLLMFVKRVIIVTLVSDGGLWVCVAQGMLVGY